MKNEHKNINFHMTFPPTLSYISRLLCNMDGTPRKLTELSELTGIPQGASSGKVGPYLCYMQYMNLLEKDKATLTRLGQLVRREDPACRELLTQWLFHANLTSVRGAEMWHFVYRELMPANGGQISHSFLQVKMAEKYGAKTRYAVVKSCYTGSLTDLHYLSDEKDVWSIQHQVVNRDFLFLYAYDLLREWDVLYPDDKEITSLQFNSFQCASCFGLSNEEYFNILEMMTEKGLIRLNRQLTPYTIIRASSTDEVQDKLYSLLL